MRSRDLAITALAPTIWGSSYIVTTEFLPGQSPLLIALLRALPAGLMLLIFVRKLPPKDWLFKLLVLGFLNFSLFWLCLFIAAYRLPGGVAATLGAVQPLFVLGLSAAALRTRITSKAIAAACLGAVGVALLVLGPEATLDPIGVIAGIGGALSMAAGVVLTRKWQPPVPPLTFTAWQLTAGGLFLLPVTAFALPEWPILTAQNLIGLAYMSIVGGALTYVLWFRGLARVDPANVSLLGVFSPLSAVLLGVLFLSETLTPVQAIGALVAVFSVWLGQQPVKTSSTASVKP